jgi:hypothetical protein
MVRNMKKVGLAALAVLALGAFLASAASAAEFHSELEHTIIKGSQAAAFNDKFTVSAGTTECENTSYSGTQATKTSTTQSASATYSGCTATFGLSVTVDPNGCEYVFHTAATNTVDIVCPGATKYIAVTAPGCEITIPEQTGLKGITFTNSSPETDIIVHIDITNQIKYIEHDKGFFPTCAMHNTEQTSNGSYTGRETIEGTNTVGAMTKIWWT